MVNAMLSNLEEKNIKVIGNSMGKFVILKTII